MKVNLSVNTLNLVLSPIFIFGLLGFPRLEVRGHLFAFWMVGLPAAWYFGLEAGGGVPGLFFGMVAGLLAASSLLGLRFAVVSRRAIRPFGT